MSETENVQTMREKLAEYIGDLGVELVLAKAVLERDDKEMLAFCHSRSLNEAALFWKFARADVKTD
jgi:hypothetical protein